MTFVLRPARADDIEFAFEVKRDAMGPHVRARWDWDEAFQRALHERRWSEKPWSIVCLDDEPVGTVSLHWLATHLQFGEFYLLAEHRGRGLGSQILACALGKADERALETRLEFLKWSPVGRLYLRHGFRIVGENEIHCFAVRRPNVA